MKKTFIFFLFFTLATTNTFAQFNKLLEFGNSPNGTNPKGDLISVGSFLYGMTTNGGIGGANGYGTIFKIKPDGTGYSKLLDFDGTMKGSHPEGSLISDGIFLYGMTTNGGINNTGVIFKIKLDGTGYSKLLDFDLPNATSGSYPYGSLISDGTFLYGMTKSGGWGTIFKIKPDGTAYSMIFYFPSTSNGGYPYGSLFYDGTFLYAMTSIGGINGKGVIFKIMPDGSGYVKLLDFAGATNGSTPYGSLISDGIFLYGMTQTGGINNNGVLFKIKTDGTGYAKLLDFSGTANGSTPYGTLISDGIFLYGMTYQGGSNNNGVIFKIMLDGTGYSNLFNFGGGTNGKHPYGALIFNGAFLYGMASDGGSQPEGMLFKIKPDGTEYSTLLNFGGVANGAVPYGDLISDGTFLYGMTTFGGNSGFGGFYTGSGSGTGGGVIFKIKADGTGYSKLYDFGTIGGLNGSNPYGSLISDGSFLYGMTSNGGTGSCTDGCGIIFKIKPDGTGFSKLLDFGGLNGQSPNGSLFLDGTFLYGMTSGGYSSNGNVFKIKTDGTGFTVLLNFTGTSNGRNPQGSLISDGTFLFGMTEKGGTNGGGTIFKIKTDGTGYIKFYDLANVSGDDPYGSLVFDGNFLYGMARNGGNGGGAIFKIKTDGTDFTKIFDFDSFSGSTSGTYPYGSLISRGNFLYGMVSQGGQYNFGALFKIKHDGTGYQNLRNFYNNGDGSAPKGSLISDGTFIYAMTTEGGGNNNGIVFSYQYCTPVNFSQTLTGCANEPLTIGSNTYTTSGIYTDVLVSLTNGCDSTVTSYFTINDSSVSTSASTLTANETSATYQWIDCNNGNAPISGQTNQNFIATENGNYSVIITKNNCLDTSSCHSISTLNINENSFLPTINIYPNPFYSQATISFNLEQKNSIIKIVDLLGKEMKSLNFTGKILILEIEDIPKGIYFLQIIDANKNVMNRKIIIQ